MVEIEEAKSGSPWSVLPIKNNKYAKDLIEVHLSDRGLTDLDRFEDFPNLEVIWLNNNNVGLSSLVIVSVTLSGWHMLKLPDEASLLPRQLADQHPRHQEIQIPEHSSCR